ncbi:hypothetical protein AX16_007655 [Volvariella volvacea WC 439]|nr:hypothetical protein AX16_007655 [Volvariella volvacea WC 439]
MSSDLQATKNVPIGLGVPPHTPHAISVSLPTWRDNVGYEEGEKRIVDAMVSGYPRFFVHLSIRKLATICEKKYAKPWERSMLFPTQSIANHCRSFIQSRASQLEAHTHTPVEPRLVHLRICPDGSTGTGDVDCQPCASKGAADLHIVFFPDSVSSIAREFWQHTGTGISSRLAEHCLNLLSQTTNGVNGNTTRQRSPSPVNNRFAFKSHNRHYAAKSTSPSQPSTPLHHTRNSSSDWSPARYDIPEDTPINNEEDLSLDHTTYVEERYGRNLPLAAAASAKRALRRRISGVLIRDFTSDDCGDEPCAGVKDLQLGPSTRGVSSVSENDVFLFPTGMSAIWNAHQLALAVLPPAKSVCFGFPYTDTLKILQKWGPGCHFYGYGLDSDLDEFEKLLEKESKENPNTPPILALFTEFPSNPLLRSANLPRLRALADKYDFLIVIDETIGNFVNVEVLPFADIVVSSLSKVFSGASNVMGGNLTLNPNGRHYDRLKSHLTSTFEDVYFDQDAIFMERNSRDFAKRIRTIDTNAEAVCGYLRSNSLAADNPPASAVIKEVFYPKYVTRELYERCRIKGTTDSPGGGYGGLFSITFTSKAASEAFFDNLACYKGPSLGTNFTLACPYTILAHYGELDWAAQYGVEAGLVRVSVGMEPTSTLLEWFKDALKAAEKAVASAQA